jgi:hypothetical protein
MNSTITGRTAWDFAHEHRGMLIFACIITFAFFVFSSLVLWGIGYRLSPEIGGIIQREVKSEIQRRFAQAYIDTRDLKKWNGVNIKRVEYDEKLRFYTVFFERAFPGREYVAVANSTRGFVVVTSNTAESVSLIDFDVSNDGRVSPGPPPGTGTGQLTLLVYWPGETK